MLTCQRSYPEQFPDITNTGRQAENNRSRMQAERGTGELTGKAELDLLSDCSLGTAAAVTQSVRNEVHPVKNAK